MTTQTRMFPLAILTLTFSVAILLTSLFHVTHGCCQKPHIVFIMTDDMGWGDVGWNSKDIYTPYLDQLRREGVTLNNSYMQPACTASRVALLTGYYPFKMGFQSQGMAQFHRWRNVSLPKSIRTLPEYLRPGGYANHMVGKWQMGFCDWEYTPTRRSFDTFYGSYGGNADHFTHVPKVGGYDFRDNLNVDLTANGSYSTELYTQRAVRIIKEHHQSKDKRPLFLFLSYEAPHVPVQAPWRYINDTCHKVKKMVRKKLCGMAAALDEGVKTVMDTLKEFDYDDNLLLVFTSDNGAPGKGGGRNWPLRGKKRSAYEGGVRVPSFLYSKTLLPKQPYVYEGLMHVTDWLPTLLSVAKMDPDQRLPSDVDGLDQWDRLRRNEDSRRTHMVYDLDREEKYGAVRINNWKLVQNNGKKCPGWFNQPAGEQKRKKFLPCSQFQLFNLAIDPIEEHDLSEDNKTTQIFAQLKDFLELSAKNATDLPYAVNNSESYPNNWNGVWSPGWCHAE